MLDSNNKDISTKGWGLMNSILEKEMPVKKNKNRLFLLLFLCLIGAGGMGLILMNSDFIFPNKNIDVVEDSINNLNQPDVSLLPITTTIPVDLSNVSKAVVNQNAELNESQKLKKNKNSGQVSINDNPSIIRNNIETAEDRNLPIPALANIDNKVFETEEKNAVAIGSEGNYNIKGIIKIIDKPEIKPIVSIAQNAVRPISSFFDNNLRRESITIVQKRNPLYIRLYAGYSFPLYSKIKGPEIGVNLGKDFSHRWGAEIGLHFLAVNKKSNIFYREAEDFNALGQAEPNEFLDSQTEEATVDELGKTSVDVKYYGLVAEKISQLYYLNVPLNVNYKITRQHQVGLGIQYHYLVNASNEDINLSEISTSLSSNNSFLGNKTLINNNLLNRHNFSIKGHYRFLITSKMGLSLSGSLGIRKILKTDAEIDSRNRMSYMNVGIDYRL